MMSKLFVLAIVWLAWCTLHSGLITPAAVRWFRRMLGGYFAFFRLGYNLFAVLTLVPVLLLSETMPYPPLIVWHWPYTILAAVFWLVAAWLGIGGARAYALGEFAGLAQIRQWQAGEGETPSRTLSRTGILGRVRHPWYTAGLIVLWTRNLAPQDLVAAAVLSIYLILGACWEERKLIAEFGEEYRRYRREVPMFFPSLRRPGKL